MPYAAISATSLSLSVGGRTLAWVDARTISVTEGTSVYYLSRDGTSALSFSGSITSNVASRGVTGGIAGIAIIVRNIHNDSDTHTVTTGSGGSFTVPGAIPGSTYAVTTATTTIATEVEPVNECMSRNMIMISKDTEFPKFVPFCLKLFW